MLHPSSIQPDVELAAALDGQILAGTKPVKVYSDWERPTNGLPTDFITVYMNGDIGGVGMDTPYADGNIMISLYCKLNDDGSVKKNRVEKILTQIDGPFTNPSTKEYQPLITDNYCFKYEAQRFITPTTPNQSSGYSITTLNLRWTTTSNINK